MGHSAFCGIRNKTRLNTLIIISRGIRKELKALNANKCEEIKLENTQSKPTVTGVEYTPPAN